MRAAATRLFLLFAIATGCLTTAPLARPAEPEQGSRVKAEAWRDVEIVSPDVGRPSHASAAQPQALETSAAASHAALPANVTPAVCPEPNSVCGYVQVPLDRKHPEGAKIGVYFEQYFHSNPGPAVSAIMVNLGGPGVTTTNGGWRDYFQFGLFAANMDLHDLLLVDDRGRGNSSAIDCQELQHGGAAFATGEQDCAAQLGLAASRYGTGDIAEDMNDVREALGYDQIDYLGGSWGGNDAIAFATRFPQHVRSLVFDSPVGPPALIPYTRLLKFRAQADPGIVARLCARSLLCAPDHANAADELSDLIKRVGAHPVEGNAYNASGNPLHVRIDEPALLDFVVRGNFTTINEVLAASVSLEQGDPAPLLRLAAEGFYTIDPMDSGDPTIFSRGAYQATACSDVGESWEWSDPLEDRMEAYNEYIESLPSDYFAPFSKSVGKDIRFSQFGMRCFWWQRPTPATPIAPRNALYPSVPTLVLSGDIDDTVPTAANKTVAALFPNGTFVAIANARHETTAWTQCGTKLANQFIETLSPGDTSCANTPEYIWPAVGRFPILAKYARPASPDGSGTNQIGEDEREVVSVAVATATDVLQRFTIGSGSGVGLRGGTFTSTGSGAYSIALTNCLFSQDVVVNGTITWNAPDGSTTAVLTVSGAGTASGTLQVSGFWEGFGPLGYFRVTGTLGGKNVAVLVPEG